MSFETVRVHFREPVCFIQFAHPETGNTINDRLIGECREVLASCEARPAGEPPVTVVVLEGSPEVFSLGADFQGMRDDLAAGKADGPGPEPLYDLWL
jgi:polyketide biosynthesis enoyl-CoA hydratase PksH